MVEKVELSFLINEEKNFNGHIIKIEDIVVERYTESLDDIEKEGLIIYLEVDSKKYEFSCFGDNDSIVILDFKLKFLDLKNNFGEITFLISNLSD
jgi:hypothetical protein